MTVTDLATYQTTQNIFLNAVNIWKTANADKFFAFKGKPQNLIDKNILNSCKHIILDSGSATTAAELNLLVYNALEEGVPSDRFVMAVSTISYD
ncbi:UNVERIFIED_CONTAM: glycoside hydrolase family 18, partial [Prevotella sp. 15_C9]